MKQTQWHGILVDQSFQNKAFLEKYSLFAKEKTATLGWLLYGVKIANTELDETVKTIQNELRSDENFYSHLYNDEELIATFKDRVFRVGTHKSQWQPILDYGAQLGIPSEQLDFWPNRFQDERHYFKAGSFV
jgi:hypothetical protein